MIIKITAKGIAVRIEAVCKAVNPPPTNNTAANKPSIDAQNIFWPFGASCLPPDVKVSTTNEPESEEVTKKLATKITVKIDEKVVSGYCSKRWYIAVATLPFTASVIEWFLVNTWEINSTIIFKSKE